MRRHVAIALAVTAALGTVSAAAVAQMPGLCPALSAGNADPAGCAGCHSSGDAGGPCHPSDFAYAAFAHGFLRPAAEVVRRGVLLPDGEVRCTSCHAPASPWRYHLAIPPGARVQAAVSTDDPSTLGAGSSEAALLAAAARGERPAVTPRPLCLGCHAFD